MKEMFHSKVLVGFIVFVLGFTYLNCLQTNRFENEDNTSREIVYIP